MLNKNLKEIFPLSQIHVISRNKNNLRILLYLPYNYLTEFINMIDSDYLENNEIYTKLLNDCIVIDIYDIIKENIASLSELFNDEQYTSIMKCINTQ